MPLVGALALLAMLPGSAEAGKRGVHQDFIVQLESRDSGVSETTRFQTTARYQWKTGRREKIAVTLPWQRVDTKVAGVSSSASGLKDMTLNYDFKTRDIGRGLSTHWQLRLNLPTGKDSLGQEQFTAVTNLNASANGFLAPQFGRGFAAGFRHYWEKSRGKTNDTYYVGYQEEGSYTVTSFIGSNIKNTGVDQITAGFKRQMERGRYQITLGLDAIFFDDSESTTNGAVTKIDSDPNYIFSGSLVQKHTDSLSSGYSLTYHARDQQDALSPGVVANLTNSELGDRIFWNWTLTNAKTPRESLTFGAAGLRTMGSKSNGVGVAGSDRTELYARLGYSRSGIKSAKWKLTTDIGLTGDSRDLVMLGQYSRDF
jgi:hypothetical protein